MFDTRNLASITAFEEHLKSLSRQFANSLYYIIHNSVLKKFFIPKKHLSVISKWRRLFRSSKGSDHVSSDEEIDKAVLDVSFQFILAKAADWITTWKGRENARSFLTVCDLWLVHPLCRYVEIYGQRRKKTEEAKHINESADSEESNLGSSADRTDDAIFGPSVASSQEDELVPNLDIEDRFLPDHIVKFRQLIYSQLNELLIQCMQYVIQEFHMVFTPEETKRMVREFNQLIESRYMVLKGSNELEVPLHLSSDGINGFIKEFMEAVCQILAPASWKALKFTFRADVPKFVKGFLIRLNDLVVIYNKYLHRRYSADTFEDALSNGFAVPGTPSWMQEPPLDGKSFDPSMDPDEEEKILDLFLFSELQKSQEIHSSIALTNSPLEVSKEIEYFSALQRAVKRNFFPGGIMVQIFREIFPELKNEQESIEKLSMAEPFFEAIALNRASAAIRDRVHHYTSAPFLNMLVIDLIREHHPDIFEQVSKEFIKRYRKIVKRQPSKEESGSVSAEASSHSQSTLVDNPPLDIHSKGGMEPTNPILHYIFSHPPAQRDFTEALVKKVASFTLAEKGSKSIWRTILGYEKLAIGAVMQLFELMQKQVFVKNLLFTTIDFVVMEIECNAFYQTHQQVVFHHIQNSSSRASKWLSSVFKKRSPFEWQRSLFDENVSSQSRFFKKEAASEEPTADDEPTNDKIYDYIQAEVKSTQQNFRSLFEYMQGSFATTLAKNLVDLITFQNIQNPIRDIALQLPNPSRPLLDSHLSATGSRGSVSSSTLPSPQRSPPKNASRSSNSLPVPDEQLSPPAAEAPQANIGISSWSTAIGTKILNVSSNLYGLSDIVGEFLVTSIQETLGPSSLLHIGSVEEVVLKLVESALELVRRETEACKRVRIAFEKVVESPCGPHFVEQFEGFLRKYLPNSPALLMNTSIQSLNPSTFLLSQANEGEITARGLEDLVDLIRDLESRALIASLVSQVVASHGSLHENVEANKLFRRLLYCMERHLLKIKLLQKLSWSI